MARCPPTFTALPFRGAGVCLLRVSFHEEESYHVNVVPAVSVTNVRRVYGSRVALDDVTFAVPSGEIFALLGPNGGGKSTLFKILSTFIPATSGEIEIFGGNLRQNPQAVRTRIGVVFQAPSLDPKLTVLENLTCHGYLYGLPRKVLRERTEALLTRMGLRDRARDFVGTLSGGLQRRVELTKGLLHRPDLLLLDEP